MRSSAHLSVAAGTAATGSDGKMDRFDEAGYIVQRICLWGAPPLEPPPLVGDIPHFLRALTNSTYMYGHHGEKWRCRSAAARWS